jgi:hypothetical protein
MKAINIYNTSDNSRLFEVESENYRVSTSDIRFLYSIGYTFNLIK